MSSKKSLLSKGRRPVASSYSVEIGSVVRGAPSPAGLLWRNIGKGPLDLAVRGERGPIDRRTRRETEIDQQRVPLGSDGENV